MGSVCVMRAVTTRGAAPPKTARPMLSARPDSGWTCLPLSSTMVSMAVADDSPGPPPLPLQTTRLLLRLHRPVDETRLLEIYSRPDVARFLLEEPWNEQNAADQTRDRLAKTDLFGDRDALALAMELDKGLVGNVVLWLTDREHRLAEIGWTLDPDYGSRGLAVEAVRAVLDLAFGHYRLHRVSAQMDARNTASARLAERVGMTREAHFRKDWWNKGEWTDTVVFAQLAADR